MLSLFGLRIFPKQSQTSFAVAGLYLDTSIDSTQLWVNELDSDLVKDLSVRMGQIMPFAYLNAYTCTSMDTYL